MAVYLRTFPHPTDALTSLTSTAEGLASVLEPTRISTGTGDARFADGGFCCFLYKRKRTASSSVKAMPPTTPPMIAMSSPPLLMAFSVLSTSGNVGAGGDGDSDAGGGGNGGGGGGG